MKTNPKLIGAFLLLMSLVFLPMAFGELQKTIATKTPTKIAFSQFVADLPEEGWFQISDMQLDVSESLYVDDDGKIGNIYVPARKKGGELILDENAAPIEVLVKTDDPKIRALLEQVKAAEAKSDDAATTFFLSNIDKFQIVTNVSGTLASGLDGLDDDDKRALERSDSKFASDFVILQQNAKPSIWGRVGMLLFGFLMLGGGLFYLLSKPKAPAPQVQHVATRIS